MYKLVICLIFALAVTSTYSQEVVRAHLLNGPLIADSFSQNPQFTIRNFPSTDGPSFQLEKAVFSGMAFNPTSSDSIKMRWITAYKPTNESPISTLFLDYVAQGKIVDGSLEVSADKFQQFPEPETYFTIVEYSIDFTFSSYANEPQITADNIIFHGEVSKISYRNDQKVIFTLPSLGKERGNLELIQVKDDVVKPASQKLFSFSWSKIKYNIDMETLSTHLSTNGTHIKFLQQATENKEAIQLTAQPVPIQCTWTAVSPKKTTQLVQSQSLEDQDVKFTQSGYYDEKTSIISLAAHYPITEASNDDHVIFVKDSDVSFACIGAVLNFGSKQKDDKNENDTVVAVTLKFKQLDDQKAVVGVVDIDNTYFVNDSDGNNDEAKKSSWKVAIIVIGLVLGAAILVAIIVFYLKSRSKRQEETLGINDESLLIGRNYV